MNFIPGPGGVLVPSRAKVKFFTSSDVFVWPKGVDIVWVTLIGGGGPGGGASNSASANLHGGGGGSGELVLRYPVQRLGAQSTIVTVGAGGTFSSGSTSGTPGGNSQFGSYIVAGGGLSANHVTSTTNGLNGAGGGLVATGATGGVTSSGGAGTWAQLYWLGGNSGAGGGTANAGVYVSQAWSKTNGTGCGATSYFGLGGAGVAVANTPGVSAPTTSYGAGGGGCMTTTATALAGGNGASGIVIVEWF